MIKFITGDGTLLDLEAFRAAGEKARLGGRNWRVGIEELAEAMPSPECMATSLLRIPRYGGGTTRAISVGHHLLWCVAFVSLLTPEWIERLCGTREIHRAQLVMWVLAHDLGEVVSNDIPSPFKRLLGEAAREVIHDFERGFCGAFLAGRLEVCPHFSLVSKAPYDEIVRFVDFMGLIPEQKLRPESARQLFRASPARNEHVVFDLLWDVERAGGFAKKLAIHGLAPYLTPCDAHALLAGLLSCKTEDDVTAAVEALLLALEGVCYASQEYDEPG